MKLVTAIVIWMAATYFADHYFFYGTYYGAAKHILQQIVERSL